MHTRDFRPPHPTPPHAGVVCREAGGDMGWGWGGLPYGYMSMLYKGYLLHIENFANIVSFTAQLAY